MIIQTREEAYTKPALCDTAAVFLSDHPARDLYCATIRRIKAANPQISITGFSTRSIGESDSLRIGLNTGGLVHHLVFLGDRYTEVTIFADAGKENRPVESD